MADAGRKNSRTLLLHLLGCAVFMAIPVFSPGDGPGGHYTSEIGEYLFTIAFFYGAYYVLIPRLLFQKRYVAFFALALLGFVVVSTLPELLTEALHPSPGPGFSPDPPPFPDGRRPPPRAGMGTFGPLDDNLLKYSFALILAVALQLSERFRRAQKEKAEAEIMFLKAQINPHFLFNTLNSIYALAVEAGADDAASAIVQLSGMMRYATGEAHRDAVSLAQELDYIDHYITLQKLRLNEKTTLQYTVEGEATNKKIAPFLLIPFVENAFKYGVSTEEVSEILISLTVSGNSLRLHVRNKKVAVRHDKAWGTSIGIGNTKQRLAMLYPKAHTLSITDDGIFFDVQLRLTL